MSDHKTSSRTEELPDGTIGAWYTEDDEEHYLGSFKDERHAQFAVDSALETLEARHEGEEPAAEAKAAAPKAAKK